MGLLHPAACVEDNMVKIKLKVCKINSGAIWAFVGFCIKNPAIHLYVYTR